MKSSVALHEKTYGEAYSRLNAAQKEVVDSIEGPVMVVAGPGTGKTQILTLRIANILRQTDTSPGGILALTFTESGASAMRERLRSFIGATAYQVPIYTFHGFASWVIKEYPEYFPHIIGARLLTDIESIDIFSDIVTGGDSDGQFKNIAPVGNRLYYVPTLRKVISDLKRENISPDKFADLLNNEEEKLVLLPRVHESGAHKGKVTGAYQKAERSLAKNRELLRVYRVYQSFLREHERYDFDDILSEVVIALSHHEDLLRTLQEQFLHFLADEHQDVNGSQNALLDQLASYGDRPNICVVGDEKQAIYRFQGASLENFLFFEERFPETKTISLIDNYRSGQKILDLAHSLIAVSDGPLKELRVPLMSTTNEEASVVLTEYPHELIEHEKLIQRIEEFLKKDVSPQDIAVLLRSNREVEDVTHLLRTRSIPVSASLERDMVTHPTTIAALHLIEAVTQPENESVLASVLASAYWGIAPDDLVRVLTRKDRDISLQTCIRNGEILNTLMVRGVEAILRVGVVIDSIRKKSITVPAHRLLEELLVMSGLKDAVVKEDPQGGGVVLRALYDEAARLVHEEGMSSLAEIARMISLYKTHNVPFVAPAVRTTSVGVQVMTVHKSKGLEFKYVFIPHVNDRVWGTSKRRSLFSLPLPHMIDPDALDESDDERRLLYVALTRAETSIYLSYAKETGSGRSTVPSRFLDELDSATYLHEVYTEAEDKESTVVSPAATLLREQENTLSPELISAIFLERGLSATALNNYLRSPWQYCQQSLLRIPEVPPLHLYYGIAIHSVLESLVRSSEWSISDIPKLLARELKKLPLTRNEYTTLHEKGCASLSGYLDTHVLKPGVSAFPEFSLRVVLETGDPAIPEIPLVGKIDRIDISESGTALQFVDYKTGTPKTRGYIEGTTKDSEGEYKRQVVFYALMLSLYDDTRFSTCDALVSFVEPDSRGKYREEHFRVSKEEIDDLTQTIISVGKSITSGEFLRTPPQEDDQEYKALAAALGVVEDL